MSAEPTYQELVRVSAHFGLPSAALVEKDFYVVKALAAIAAVELKELQSAPRLWRRHGAKPRAPFDPAHVGGHRSADRDRQQPAGERTLRRLRARVTEALLGAGFKFDPEDPAYRKIGNETRYTIYRLPYEPAAVGEGALRPTIQIETAVWPLYRPAVELPVISSGEWSRHSLSKPGIKTLDLRKVWIIGQPPTG